MCGVVLVLEMRESAERVVWIDVVGGPFNIG